MEEKEVVFAYECPMVDVVGNGGEKDCLNEEKRLEERLFGSCGEADPTFFLSLKDERGFYWSSERGINCSGEMRDIFRSGTRGALLLEAFFSQNLKNR